MKVWLNILMMAGLLALAPAVLAQSKVGYVDWKLVLESAPQIPVAREKLDREFRQRNIALEADQERLASLEQQLQTEGPLMSASRLTELERETRNLRRRVTTERGELADEFDFRLSEERQLVERQILTVVRSYAIDNNYDLITPGPVLYASDALDLTDEIIAMLRQQTSVTGSDP